MRLAAKRRKIEIQPSSHGSGAVVVLSSQKSVPPPWPRKRDHLRGTRNERLVYIIYNYMPFIVQTPSAIYMYSEENGRPHHSAAAYIRSLANIAALHPARMALCSTS